MTIQKTNIPIRKAVIPVAGFGTRFLPATKAMPKEMLPIIDRPSVQFAVEAAVAAGITDIVLVTGYSKRAIEDHFDRNFELEYRLKKAGKNDMIQELHRIANVANIVYVRQKSPLGNGHAVLVAKHLLDTEPFVVIWPDDLVIGKKNPIQEMIDVYQEYEAPVVGVLPVRRKDVSKYGIIQNKHIRGNRHEVFSMVEKPAVDKAPSNLASVGGFVLPPTIFDYLKRLKPGKGGEIWLIDAVNAYNRDHAVFACELSGELYDLGSKLGWLKANVAVGLQHPELKKEFRQYLKGLNV